MFSYFLIFLIPRSICWNNTQQHTTFHVDFMLCTFSLCTTFNKRKRCCNCITLLLHSIKRGAQTLSEVFRAGRLLLIFKTNCKLLIYEHFSQFLKTLLYTWRRTEEFCVMLLWWSKQGRQVTVHPEPCACASLQQTLSVCLEPADSARVGASFQLSFIWNYGQFQLFFPPSVYCTASGTRLEK